MLLHPRGTSRICGYDSVMDPGDQDCIGDDGWFELIWFSDMSHFLCHIGVYSPFRPGFIDPPLICMITLILRYTSGWWFDLIMSWYSEEPLLSLSARSTFSGIIVVLGWSYLRRVDSRITISAEYMLDTLYVPMELFLTYQDRSDISDAILGHISLL